MVLLKEVLTAEEEFTSLQSMAKNSSMKYALLGNAITPSSCQSFPVLKVRDEDFKFVVTNGWEHVMSGSDSESQRPMIRTSASEVLTFGTEAEGRSSATVRQMLRQSAGSLFE
jgi:hypothetical protein